MFNLNIDELMNQDINQVNNSKQEKKTFNKYFDDFTSFIGKSIDMFSSMSFKTKFVCFFEHLGIVGIMTLILYIIGAIGSSIFSNLFGFASYKVYNILHGIVSSLYLICSVILIFIIVVTSFKRRYLDYYVIVHSEKDNAKKVFTKLIPEGSVSNSAFTGTAYYDTHTKKISMHYAADLKNKNCLCNMFNSNFI